MVRAASPTDDRSAGRSRLEQSVAGSRHGYRPELFLATGQSGHQPPDNGLAADRRRSGCTFIDPLAAARARADPQVPASRSCAQPARAKSPAVSPSEGAPRTMPGGSCHRTRNAGEAARRRPARVIRAGPSLAASGGTEATPVRFVQYLPGVAPCAKRPARVVAVEPRYAHSAVSANCAPAPADRSARIPASLPARCSDASQMGSSKPAALSASTRHVLGTPVHDLSY